MTATFYTTDKTDHYHVAYVGEDGFGMTSIAKGHSHGITPGEAPTEVDPMLGQPIPSEPIPVVEPAIDHSHELVPYVPVQKKVKEDEKEALDGLLMDFAEAKTYEDSSRKSGYESEDMYSHNQWNPMEEKELTEKNRAALTINRLEEKIDNLSGYQRQNRTEIKYLPIEGTDSRACDILNIFVKVILDNCYYAREKSKVFEDQAIVGRGLFNIYEDYERNLLGDLVVEKFKWDECYFLPHEKEDLSDCDGIIKAKWYSRSKILQLYPELKDKLNPENKEQVRPNMRSEDWDQRISEQDLIDTNAKKYRLLERIKKEYTRYYVLANPDQDIFYPAIGWSKADVNAVKTIPGFSVIPRVSYILRNTKSVGDKLVEDEYMAEDDLDFPIVPAYAKKRGDAFWGKIEAVKDLQRLVNKAYSQFIDIIAKVANYGYYYDSNTFPNKREAAKFRKNASSPGFVQEVANVDKRPVKEEGVKFPGEIVKAIELFNVDMRQIMNVNLELAGMGAGANQSGVAMRQKIVQQLLGNDYIFDNLSFAEKVLAKIILRKIAKLYSPSRIARVVAAHAAKMDQSELSDEFEYNEEEIASILQNADFSKYDATIGESPAAPSAMMGNFLMLMELASSGVQIPASAILQFAPMPNKEKIIAAIQEEQQRQQAMEELKYKTEIEKANIARMGRANYLQTPGTQPQSAVPGY